MIARCLIVTATASLRGLVYDHLHTPVNIESLNALLGPKQITLTRAVEETVEYSSDFWADFTTTAASRYSIRRRADELGVPYYCMSCSADDSEQWLSAVQELKLHFGWEGAVLVADLSYARLYREASKDPTLKTFLLSPDTSEASAFSLMTREVKTTGLRSIFIAAHASLTESLLKTAKSVNMDIGFAYTLIDKGCLYNSQIFPSGLSALSRAATDRSLMKLATKLSHLPD
jgi:hypothetical protein